MRLTDRETEVLALISRGWLVDSIAPHLGVTKPTVDTYMRSIRRKLRAVTDAHAVALAYESGQLGGNARRIPPAPVAYR